MSTLKGLTFSTYTRPDTQTAEVRRRLKLIAHLQEQLEMIGAEAVGKAYTVSKRKWLHNEDGTKAVVEVGKRLKPWYRTQANGTILLTVRYGSKPLEFEKGKAAIVVKNRDELLALLPKLIAAVEAGELDNHIAATMKVRGVIRKKTS